MLKFGFFLNLTADFETISFKKSALSGPISGFFKNKQRWGAVESTPAPHFLGRNAVCESAEALRSKISLVLPSRSDWNGVAADFLHDRSPGHVWVTEEFFAKCNSHFKVHGVGIYAVFRLPDNNIPHDPAGEVKHCQSRIV